jgi:chromosome segregation ATPase
LDVRVAELEKQLNSEHESLNAQKAVVDSKIAELNRKLSESSAALGSMTEEHEVCNGREQECISEKDKHAKDVARLTAELEEAMTEKHSLKEQIEALTSQSGDETK